MPVSPEVAAALVSVRMANDEMVVELRGRWQTYRPRPTWDEVRGERWPAVVRLEFGPVESWDSSLVLFLAEVRRWSDAQGSSCDFAGLPERMRRLLDELAASAQVAPPRGHDEGFLAMVGRTAVEFLAQAGRLFEFVGACVISVVTLLLRPRQFRWRDCLTEMQLCGAMALPIVGLISLLVGLIMGYQAAVQLRQFGADIYVADLVGVSVVREMGPLMAAIILAGRTGAAFAATIGNMKANEEIDALETLGVSPVDFLVMPRLVALALMMPLLALYANLLGVLGGMFVSAVLLEIPPSAYWIETRNFLDASDLLTGLFKSFTFGILVGIAGCLRGLEADRSAAGVGRAATSAVVTGILFIILADAVYAVLFNVLDW